MPAPMIVFDLDGTLVDTAADLLDSLNHCLATADMEPVDGNDLRRIVDEFSKFARMPAPERRSLDLTKLIGDAILLQETARPDIRYITKVPGHAVLAQLDGTMISQALTNLLKNASEAIDEALEADKSYKGEIHVALTLEPDAMIIDIEDNGPGLPDQPARLFEPYVTNRPKGTGLGLPIVKKIVEEHGGTLDLLTAAPFEGADHCGARVRIVLPRTSAGTSPETSENSSAFAEKLRERIK